MKVGRPNKDDLAREEVRWNKVLAMFPNWRDHLGDGATLDQILAGINQDTKEFKSSIGLNKCSRSRCPRPAQEGYKQCFHCRETSRLRMREERGSRRHYKLRVVRVAANL